MSNNFSNAMGAVGQFVAAHPELDPSKVEYTVQTILRYLKGKKLPVTLANLEAGWTQIVDAVSAMKPEVEATVEAADPEIETYRKQIESWSADQLREYCKDPEISAAINAVLNSPRPQKIESPKVVPPKAKATKPVLTAEEQAVESLSADQMKKALRDPAKARGIENVLRGLAAKRRAS